MLVFIVFSGETAYSYITEESFKNFNCIFFNKIYEMGTLAEKLQEAADKHDCFGFCTYYDYSDRTTEINICTRGSTEKVKSLLGMDDCAFNTITSGSFDISFMDIDEANDKVGSDFMIQTFFVDGSESDIREFTNDLKRDYDVTLNSRTDYTDNSVIAAAVCIFTIMLLNIYDILNMKRNVSISLTLGNPLLLIIGKEFAKDTAAYTASAAVLSLILSRVTAIVLIKDKIVIYTAVLLLLTLLSYTAFYFVDICSSLKHENHSAIYMPINYSLKIISSFALVLLIVLSGKLMKMKNKYECVEDFKNEYGGYSRIVMTGSPYLGYKFDSLVGKDGVVADGARELMERKRKILE